MATARAKMLPASPMRRRVAHHRYRQRPPPRAVALQREARAVIEQCCSGDLTYLLLQINVICLLLALIGSAVIVKHPDWFGDTSPAITQAIAER